jgi:hypothetical protein
MSAIIDLTTHIARRFVQKYRHGIPDDDDEIIDRDLVSIDHTRSVIFFYIAIEQDSPSTEDLFGFSSGYEAKLGEIFVNTGCFWHENIYIMKMKNIAII